MPLESDIDVARRLVIQRATGVLTGSEILAEQLILQAHPEFDARHHQLVDFTEATGIAVSTEEIRLMADRSVFAPGSRRAFVVVDALQYGLLRTFYASTRGESGEMQIFATRRDADRWIDGAAQPPIGVQSSTSSPSGHLT